MATFIQGVTDTPAPMQLYKPDYDFLSQVYNAKQTSYEKGFNYIRSIYNSQLNNPLTSTDNQKYRQDVFKKIQDTLKEAGALDLSNPANINYALQAMDPISKDKQLAYDMQVTSMHNNEMQKLEAVRSSLDPKVSGTYNEFSKRAIGYATNDLREAKRDDGSIFKVAPQKFIPYQDVVADLNKAAKEQNLNIEIESATGTGYMVKQSNGQLAYKPYTKWALSAMGNRYDAQLQQQGYVEGEGLIRGTMQKDNLSRKDAIDQISTPIMKQLYQEAVQNGTYSDARIKEYDLQISKFRDKYGSRGINPNSTEAKTLASILKQKQGYVDDLATAKADLNKMEEQGESYITSNLYNIFTNQAKKRVAGEWAIGHADATKKVEVETDETWMGKMREAHQDARHLQDINLRGRALDETIRNNRFNNKIAQQNADINMFKLKFGDLSKMPREITAGTYEGSEAYGANILHNDLNKVEDGMYNKAFASDGLIGILYNSDKKDLQTISPIISKIRNMANGGTEKLTAVESKSLADFAQRSGIKSFNPLNSAQAKYALREMAMGVYEQGQIKIETYPQAKNSKVGAEYLAKFGGMRADFKKYSDTMTHIEENYNNIAKEVIDPKTGQIKDIYAGATIIGFTRSRKDKNGNIIKGSPMIDFSGLQGDANAVAAKMEMIQKRTTPDYQGKKASSGSKLIATNIKAEEYLQFFEHNVNLPQEVSSALSGSLGTGAIKNLYGTDATIAYDGGKEMAIVTIKGDPTKIKAYNKATTGMKLQESYEFQIPYDRIQRTPALSRLDKYVEGNTITSANTSTLSPLVTNPTGTVRAPKEKRAMGFDYTVIGGKDSTGNYGVHVIASYKDPYTGKEVTIDKRITKTAEQSQDQVLSAAEKLLNDTELAYQSYRIQSDESFKPSGNDQDFDEYVNSVK